MLNKGICPSQETPVVWCMSRCVCMCVHVWPLKTCCVCTLLLLQHNGPIHPKVDGAVSYTRLIRVWLIMKRSMQQDGTLIPYWIFGFIYTTKKIAIVAVEHKRWHCWSLIKCPLVHHTAWLYIRQNEEKEMSFEGKNSVTYKRKYTYTLIN